eukprot:1605748-Rhodomonas_salina.1
MDPGTRILSLKLHRFDPVIPFPPRDTDVPGTTVWQKQVDSPVQLSINIFAIQLQLLYSRHLYQHTHYQQSGTFERH